MNLDSTLLSLHPQLSTRRENESQIMWPTRAYVSQSGKPGTHEPSLSWFIITSSDYPGRFYLHGPVGLHRWQHPTPLGLRFVRIFISLGLGTKRLCSTRGQKRGFFARGAKQRPSSLPAFFQSISLLEICAISFCITEEKSEMPEISCMAFCLFIFRSRWFCCSILQTPRLWVLRFPSHDGVLMALLFWQLAFWISEFWTESNGTYGDSTWGSANMAVFPWDHPNLLTTSLAAWATDTRHLKDTRMLVKVVGLSILFSSTNRHCDGCVMR